MGNWMRITLVVFVLLGGVASFGFWSVNQFDKALDDLSAAYLADTLQTHSFLKQQRAVASAALEASLELATSTEPVDLELSFTFPDQDDEVYIGCVYPISWDSSVVIRSLQTSLVDAGTREPAGPVASGLAKENTIEEVSQKLNWEVGAVWPGKYYIKITEINGIEAEFRSGIFEVSGVPENIDESEKSDFCRAMSV